MKIAVTADGATLDAQVNPRFGRSPYHLFIETDDMSFEVAQNPYANIKPCAGARAAKFFAGKGVRAILTGNCAPGHREHLQNRGIEVILGLSGQVRQVVEQLKRVNEAVEKAEAGAPPASL